MIKKLLLGIVVVVVVLVVVLAIVAALQPAHYHIERSATMNAPAPVVFAQVNDFHKWEAWSPWAKIDPAAKYTYDGPTAGIGAIFTWAGNKQVGEGRMTVTESRPTDLIRIKLEFIKPFPSDCLTEFSFKPEGNNTIVTWAMSGTKNFMSKAVCMFMNMDKMVGGDFETGLASMKTVAETALKP